MTVGACEDDRPPASSVDIGELTVAFAGRGDVADLWERLRAGEEIDDPTDLVRVHLAESRAHERAGRFDEAVQAAQRALRLAESIDDSEGIAGGLSHLSYARYRVGQLDEATNLAEQALRQCGPHSHTVTAQHVLGLIALDACRWDRARERFTTARAWSNEVGYSFGSMLALHNLSVVYFHTGRFDVALAAANDVSRLNAEIAVPGWAYAWTRAVTSQVVGDRIAAREALNEIAALDPPAAIANAFARVLEAQLALDEDDIDEAERALVAARLDVERLGSPLARAFVLLVTSRVRRAHDDPSSARGWIEEAAEEVRRSQITTLEGWVQLERARVVWALGDESGAESILRAALAAADERSAAHVAAEASVLLAVLATVRGEPDADEAWVDAAARVRTGGYGFLLERDRSLVLRPIAALARRHEPAVRDAGQVLLDQLARTSPAPLHIVGLGRFSVSQGRRRIASGDLRKRRAGDLLRVLLLQRQRRGPRDVIVDALWPDQPAESALASFHQASSMLRRVLEPDLPEKYPSRYLHVDGDVVVLTLPTGSSVDFERFEALAADAVHRSALSSSELRAALDLYDGELFPDDLYADWAVSRRTRLSELAASIASSLAVALLEEGDARAALDVCLEAMDRHPVREDAVLVGMRSALAIGDRITALKLYRRCEQRLADDLGVSPSPALRELAATIGA